MMIDSRLSIQGPKAPLLQRGVALLFALVVMAILLIGAVALVKSMDTSLSSAGNIAFRRDMVNQGELVLHELLKKMQTGEALSSLGNNSDKSINYSAIALATNAEGIPIQLASSTLQGSDDPFNEIGTSSNDITANSSDLPSSIQSALRGTRIRYVIERMCRYQAEPSPTHCVQAMISPAGGTAGTMRPRVSSSTVYRINIRVSGPRDTEVFLQASINKPE